MPLKIHHDEQPTLNLTSMIDVTFLLIIFFMVGTEFTELERNISVRVPQVKNAGTVTPAPSRRTVTVHRDGTITLDKQLLTLEQLEAALATSRQQNAKLGVIVRGDADGPFQNVAAVLNACRQAGISDLGISVRLAQTADSSQTKLR